MICKKCAQLSEKKQDAHRLKSFYKKGKQYIHICFYKHKSLWKDPKKLMTMCALVGRGTGQTEDRSRKELLYACKYFLIFQPYECITHMKATMKHLQLLLRAEYHAQSPQCTLHSVDSDTTYITKFNSIKVPPPS